MRAAGKAALLHFATIPPGGNGCWKIRSEVIVLDCLNPPHSQGANYETDHDDPCYRPGRTVAERLLAGTAASGEN
jgi:hypothetical protein